MKLLQTSAMVLAAALLIGLGAWLDTCTGPDVDQLKAQRDTLEGQVLALRIRDRARADADSSAAAAVAVAQARADSLIGRSQQLGDSVQRLSGSLRRLLQLLAARPRMSAADTAAAGFPAPAIALLDQLDSAHAGEQRACLASVRSCEAAAALERGRVAQRDSAIAEREQLLGGYRNELNRAIRLATRWPTWRRVGTAAACVAAGAAAIKGNAALAIGGGVGCAGSFALR